MSASIKIGQIKNINYLLPTLGIILGTSSSTSVLANGALPYCMGAKMCQMGGAGAAVPLDATSGNVNPALMAKVGRDAALQPITATD